MVDIIKIKFKIISLYLCILVYFASSCKTTDEHRLGKPSESANETTSSGLKLINLETLAQAHLKKIANRAKEENNSKWFPRTITGYDNGNHYDQWAIQGTKTSPNLFIRRYDEIDSFKGNLHQVISGSGKEARNLMDEELAVFLIQNDIILPDMIETVMQKELEGYSKNHMPTEISNDFSIYSLKGTNESQHVVLKKILTQNVKNRNVYEVFEVNESGEIKNKLENRQLQEVLETNQIKTDRVLAYFLEAKNFQTNITFKADTLKNIDFGSGMTWNCKNIARGAYDADIKIPLGSFKSVVKIVRDFPREPSVERMILERIGNTEGIVGYFGSVKTTAFHETALVMEKCNHSNLFERNLAQQLLHLVRGLKSLHALGYCHGDPHPGNIQLNSQDQLVWIDFGAATKNDARKITDIIELGKFFKEEYTKVLNETPDLIPAKLAKNFGELLDNMATGEILSIDKVESSLEKILRETLL